jgi:SAM-dependent methyltransferase
MSTADARSYWNDRYGAPKRGATSASGTFTHLEEANRWFYRTKFNRVQAMLRNNGISVRGASVLDAACGTGAFVPLWLRLGARQVTGLDLSDTAVEVCARRYAEQPRCQFRQFDLSSPVPPPNVGTHDLVCIFEAIFLLTAEKDFLNGIGHLCSWLKPGGHLLWTDQLPENTVTRHERLTYYSRDTYEREFARHGVELVGQLRQSCLFNRHILPEKLQLFVESRCPWLLYGLDWLVMRSPLKNAPGQDEVYYWLAQKTGSPGKSSAG